MIRIVQAPTVVPSVGTRPKRIEEFIGRVNTPEELSRVPGAPSIARMRSPAGWLEPGQTPAFDEYTLVLAGALRVESRVRDDARVERTVSVDVQAGQAVIAPRGEWVRYSTPGEHGAEYVAVCLPAFAPDTVHRDP
jgi:mannose-6-phosphate isomerase-like protein (cupin superfamily)